MQPSRQCHLPRRRHLQPVGELHLRPAQPVAPATVSTNVAPAKTFGYDQVGNILSKSDVGTYAYNPPGGPLPHAVMSISGSTVSTTYTYDLNGNQTSGFGRTVTWTSYNKPSTITQGARSASFLHDMDHQRFKQVSTGANGAIQMTPTMRSLHHKCPC